jgi:SAM-dependent methyltransferase
VCRPAKIFATDLFSFVDTWHEIEQYCRDRYDVSVEFRQAPLEDHSFLSSGSIDLCSSYTVLEHCQSLADVMRETRRVVDPDGFVYAGYGPLWHTASGDHFGRGELSDAFNHVALSKEEYERYFAKYRGESEDAQSGGRYVELELFSYLTTRQYLETFRAAGFSVDALILQVDPVSRRFARAYPDRFEELVERYRSEGVERDDFLIKANHVRLRPI